MEKVPRSPAILPGTKPPAEDDWPEHIQVQQKNVLNTIISEDLEEARKKRRRMIRRWTASATILVLFIGGLYSTSVFLQRSGIVDGLYASAPLRTGRANTDINLRPSPSADNDPIGLVTKNSRIRILKAQSNWYQVEIIEQGRERSVELSSERGWLNSRYVDLD